MFFATRSSHGLSTAALLTAGVAAAVGVGIAVLAVGFHVPAWAASLGVGLGVMVWLQRQHQVTVVSGAYDPGKQAMYWFAGVVAISTVGGLFGLVRPIRRTVGGFRRAGDPALRRGRAAATSAALAIIASTVLASVAGVLLALSTRPLPAGENGLALTSLGLGAALLGGTSVFGRRGGVFGTILAVVVLVVLWRYAEARHWNLSSLAVGAAAVLAGLVVTRLVESFGGTRYGGVDDLGSHPQGWASTIDPPVGGTDTSWFSGSRTGGWTSQLPARTTGEGWGPEDRWGVR